MAENLRNKDMSTMNGTLKRETFSADGKPQSYVQKTRIVDLEYICLSVIISNFDRFNTAYKLSNNSIPAVHLEFLERCYSELLFTSLKRKRTLKADHFEFLINPRLKELDLVDIDKELLKPLIDKVKCGNNVQCCKAKSGSVKETELYERLISSLRSIEIIEYRGVTSGKLMRSIANSCPHLRILILESEEIYDRTLYNNGVTDIITSCPCLEIFKHVDTMGALYRIYSSLSRMPFKKKKKYSALKGVKKHFLKTLSSERDMFSIYSLSDALEICAIVCPHVSCLHIDHVKSKKQLDKCLLFPLLEDVTFERISNITAPILHNFLSLTREKLIGLDLLYEGWLSLPDIVQYCPNLESLTLRCHRVSDMSPAGKSWSEDLPCIARLSHLTALQIKGLYIRDGPVANKLRLLLSLVKGITKLSLTDCRGLTTEFFRTFNLYHIYELDLSWSDINSESVKDIILHGHLQKLILKYCANVTLEDYFMLSSCQSNDPTNTVEIIWFSYDNHTDCLFPRRWS